MDATPPELAHLARLLFRQAEAAPRHGADLLLLAADAAEEVAREAAAAALPAAAQRWRLAAETWRAVAPIFAAP